MYPSSRRILIVALVMQIAGCGPSPAPPPAKSSANDPVVRVSDTKPAHTVKTTPIPNKPPQPTPPPAKPPSGKTVSPAEAVTAPPVEDRKRIATAPDADRLRAHGIRRVEGKHILLFTDHLPDAEVDALPRFFDQAYPQWCDYFDKPDEKAKPWRVNAFLIVDRDRCRGAGILPDDLPSFRHGYARNLNLWLYEQPSAYYRRHLLLHEGTHAFMQFVCDSLGPPWYAEGIAELLATHELVNGQVRLHHFPRSREETPQLGRIRMIQDEVAAGRRLTVGDVLAFSANAHLRDEPYAYSWALATILEQRPNWRNEFRGMQRHVAGGDFTPRFLERLGLELPELRDAWTVFLDEVTHHYDLDRAAIAFGPGEVLPAGGAVIQVDAARGWQSARIMLEKGKRYQLSASGQCVIAQTGVPWPSEPGGVSVRYYQGRPLGRLLAVMRPDAPDAKAPSAFLTPLDVGLSAIIEPTADGTLYLRINDSPAELADNKEAYQVRIAVKQ